MTRLFHDLRLGLRRLWSQPGFSALAVLTLALGIGAGTAIFSVLDAVLLQPLPYRDADRLVVVWVDFGEAGQSLPASSPSDFRDYRLMTTAFESFAAGRGSAANIHGTGEPEHIALGRVSAGFFPLLGIEPVLGRGFEADEDVAGGPAIALLSHELWQRRFGADRAVIGRSLLLDGSPHEVVGVLPAGFELLLPPEAFLAPDTAVWVPLQDVFDEPRNRTTVTVIGRLARGVTLDRAQDEMTAVAQQLRAEHPVLESSDMRLRLVPLHDDIVKASRPALYVVTASAVLLLLIACGNVTTLLLARTAARSHEVTLRQALGASRGDIVRQVLGESLGLAAAAGLAGVALAHIFVALLRALGAAHLPRFEDASVDPTSLAFTAGASLLTTLLVGLAPAWRASRGLGLTTLARAGRSGRLRRRSPLSTIVVAQVAFSVVLLLGCGLLVRSFLALRELRPGFDADRVLTFRIALPGSQYASDDARDRFFTELQERLLSLPGVRSAGATSGLPLSGHLSQAPYAYDEATSQSWESVTANARTVTPGYFRTVGTRLLAGRNFSDGDNEDSPLVVIVDENLARKAWADGNAIGRRLQLPVFGPDGIRREWIEVIGVVEHARLSDLARDELEQVFLPYRQSPSRRMDVVVRAHGAPDSLAGLVGAEVATLDKDLPLHRLRSFDGYVSDAMAQDRFTLALVAGFAIVALGLAVVGLYGVMSYAVNDQRRELGVRLALGAQRTDVVRLVLRRGLALIGGGLVIGLLAALLAGRALAGLLFGVGVADPTILVATVLVLLTAGILACWVPARRGARFDPVEALRAE